MIVSDSHDSHQLVCIGQSRGCLKSPVDEDFCNPCHDVIGKISVIKNHMKTSIPIADIIDGHGAPLIFQQILIAGLSDLSQEFFQVGRIPRKTPSTPLLHAGLYFVVRQPTSHIFITKNEKKLETF